MNRRGIFASALAAAAGALGGRANAQPADTPRVVYHLADLDKAIQNAKATSFEL